MSEKRLRSGKRLVPSQIFEQDNKQKSDTKKLPNVEESMMSDAVLEELKLMRSDLTSQIKKLSDDAKLFQRNTNERLQKVESVISKLEEIDGLKFKQQELEAGFDSLKTSLNSMITNTEEIDNLRRNNDDLRKKVEHLERYSRDFNIRISGVREEDGEETRLHVLASNIQRLKLRTRTVQGKSSVRSLDISLPSLIAGHLKGNYFKVQKVQIRRQSSMR
ncbi:uncharacterized protein LOC141889585 [Acropora palmata]|uniref:uncharacterized protein LOC141889585 n=1 Tax=Acropora palmata TaxID=6131 RepID=UPI003D9FFB4C